MKNFIHLIALITGLCLFALPLRAETYYGLAMHGAPKYERGFDHLDYANPDAPKGGHLKMTTIGTFDNLNPYAIKGKAAQGLNLYYDRLMARVWDEPFTMYPLIAERVEIPEDRSAITVHINPEARFHDGSPVTADDVIFSFKTLRDHGRPNMRSIYRLVEDIEKRDDLTVHFAFGEGYDQETVMIIAMMPVLSKSWWQGKSFDSTTLEAPISNGPYRIAEVDPGRSITYERAEDYWAKDLPVNKGHYNFDKITYFYFRDDMVAFEAFKAGNADLRRENSAALWASQYDFPAVQKGEVITTEIEHGRPERVRALIFNTRRPPFDNRNVRQALSNLLDFEWLNENLFHGKYRRITSFYPNSELAATTPPDEAEIALLAPWRNELPPEVFTAPFAPPSGKNRSEIRHLMRQADDLLTEAGWIVKDGKRVHETTGDPLSFEILLTAPEDEKIALSYIRNLDRLGITTTIRVLDDAAYRGRLNEYNFDMTLYYWQNSLSPGTEQMLYWSCEAAEQPARWNFPGICHPAIDTLAKNIAEAKDRQELVTATRALDRVLSWGHYVIPLYYAGYDMVAYRNHIRRPVETPVYGMVLETWWAQEQKEK